MNWDQLLSTKRFGLEDRKTEATGMARNQFQRDYDRILFSSAFRRLQNKTQVFPLPRTIFVHNRLTHSLEVASVGKSLGNLVANHIVELDKGIDKTAIQEIGTIVAAGCLAHDMGNPPFGHAGEDAISAFFTSKANSPIYHQVTEKEWQDLIHFEGNANALRLLTHQMKGRRKGGFALTYSTLASIIKYPYDSSHTDKKKFGYFQTEKNSFQKITNELKIKKFEYGVFARHPLVYLVEAADDICYQVMDLEDAHRLQIISNEEAKSLFLDFFDEQSDKIDIEKINQTFNEVTDKNEQIAYLRAVVINKLVNEAAAIFSANYTSIMDGSFKGSLMKGLTGTLKAAITKLIDISINRIYKDRSVVEIEIAGYKIIGSLLEEFIDALLKPQSSYAKSLLSLIPEQFVLKHQSLYPNIRSVLDFISGMTDEYALNLYRKIKGINLPEIR